MDSVNIPLDFMDQHILRANHAYAMVYLCAYRYHTQNQPIPSPSQIAKLLGLKISDVEDAIRYWKDEGFHLFDSKIALPQNTKSAVSPKEIASFVQSDKDLQFLYQEAQRMLGKVLSTSDAQTLFWIYDYLGLPTSVILLLLTYAQKEGKARIRYIEKTASNWAEQGIDTLKKAERYLAELEQKKTYEYHVKSLLGISYRPLTPGEAEIVASWQTHLKPSDELLVHAYEICIERRNSLSLKYINGILKNWAEKGISTKEQALGETKPKPVSQPKKTGFSNFTPRPNEGYKKLEQQMREKRIAKAKQEAK